MERALRLARRGVGATSPNPMVGAVLVKGGQIIGEGWHKRAGEAHADEPFAVEFLSYLFEQGDAALVGLDQVVVGRQDRGDRARDERSRT